MALIMMHLSETNLKNNDKGNSKSLTSHGHATIDTSILHPSARLNNQIKGNNSKISHKLKSGRRNWGQVWIKKVSCQTEIGFMLKMGGKGCHKDLVLSRTKWRPYTKHAQSRTMLLS